MFVSLSQCLSLFQCVCVSLSVCVDNSQINHEIEFKLDLEVEKESHELRLTKTNLNPSEISCNRNTRLDVEILNLGEDEEDEVRLEITNFELEINIVEQGIELEEGIDDSSFRKTFSISLDENLDPGNYPIIINAYYDENELSDSKTVDMIVGDCEKVQEVKMTTPTFKTVAQIENVVNKTVVQQAQVVQPQVKEEIGFFQSIINWFFKLF